MQSQSSLSVVFVTYNSEKSIRAAILSVQRHLPDAEIIVVDNGSTDETSSLVSEMERVRLIEGHGNVGFGAGVNLGANAAAGDLLLVLNPDTTVVEADRARLSYLALQTPVGMRGCRLTEGRRMRRTEYSEWSWRSELYWLIVQWFFVPREWTVRRPGTLLGRSRRWVPGAAFLVNREELLAIGGFDEHLFLYFEDMDLCRRYREQGARVSTTDAIVVTHEGQGSAHGGHEQIQGWALLSFLELVAKWRGQRSGERAARSALRLLGGVSAVAQWAAVLPVVGPRATRKQRSAAIVRSTLLRCMDLPPTAGAYPRARASVAAATGTDR